jgi:hypothetical protein
VAYNKENLQTSKLMADMQLRKDLNEVERERFGAMMALMEKMPGGKIRSQIQYIEKNLLPEVERKRGGKAGPDYKFFESLVASLKWSLVCYDRLDYLLRKDSLLRLEKQILLDRLDLYERELQKYTTMEEIHLREAFEMYDKTVRDKIKGDLEGK